MPSDGIVSHGVGVPNPSHPSLDHKAFWEVVSYLFLNGGSEGFVERVAQEVASFGIEFTIAEPSLTRTNFAASMVGPPPMAVYEEPPSGEFRRIIASGGFKIPGDPVRMAQAIIDSADRTPAPKRLTMGGSAYTNVRAALVDRIAVLDAQKDLAFSTDFVETGVNSIENRFL